jgi:rhamnosyltransferase
MNSCSVIIPTLNAEHSIERLVSQLRAQSVPPDEIIVIDSSSTDGTPRMAADLGCVVMTIPRAEFSHGGTRNKAAMQAKGDILVYLTQDALPVDNRFLEHLVHPLRQGISAAYARQVPYPSARPTEVFARAFNYPAKSCIRTRKSVSDLGIRAYFFSNVASAIRKDVFMAHGMFPDDVIMNEDMIFCAKLIENGHSVMYVADAMVYHSHNYSAAQTFQRYFDIGAFYAHNMNKKGEMNIKSAGTNYTGNLFAYLFREKKISSIPFSIAETCAKFLGFYSGRVETYLPLPLKKKMSLHKGFWRSSN